MSFIRRTAAAAALLGLLAGASLAYAHASIKAQSPRKGSTVSKSVRSATITFGERVSAGKLTVKRGSRRVSSKRTSLVGGGKVLRVSLSRKLKAGKYKASYKYLASDGDVVNGSWTFRIK